MASLLFITSIFLFWIALTCLLFVVREIFPVQHPSRTNLQIWFALMVIFVFLGSFLVFLPGVQPLLAAALAIGLATAVFHPAPPLAFYVVLLFTRPWELFPDNTVLLSLPKVGASICLGSWLIHGLVRRDMKFYLNPFLVLFGVFLAWLYIAAAMSGNPDQGFQYLSERFFPASALLILSLHVVERRAHSALLIECIVIAVVSVGVEALGYTFLGFAPELEVMRLQSAGLLGNANDLAALFVIALPFCFFPDSRRSIFGMASGMLFAGFLVSCIWLTQSRGAVLSCLAMFGAYFLFVHGRTSWKKLVLAFLCVGVCSLLFMGIGRDAEELSMSSTSRWNYVLAGIGMVKSSPLFGVGPGRYPDVYEQFTPDFVEWGQRTAHSSWVLIMSEAGIPGVFLFMSLWLGVGIFLWRSRRSIPGFALSFLGYTVAMSFLSHSYLFMVYLLLGLSLARLRIVHSEERVTEVPESAATENKQRSKRGISYRRLSRRVPMRGVAMVVGLLVFFPLWDVRAEESRIQAAPGIDKPCGDFTPTVSSSISLSGARGETVSFLLRLETGEGCGALEVSAPDTVSLHFFQMLPFRTVHPSYIGAPVGVHYDPLIPLQSVTICQKKDTEQWLYGEIEIAKEKASPKEVIQIGYRDSRVDIDLRVFRFEIGERPIVPIYTEVSTYWSLIGHFGKWEPHEAELALLYRKMLAKHRIQTLTTFIVSPPVDQRGDRPYADFFQKPTPDQSFSAVNIVDRPDWAFLGFPTVPNDEAYNSETARYFQGIENALPELPPYPHKLVYLWDEPAKEMFPALKHLAKVVKTVAPSLKVLVTTNYDPSLASLVDIFVPVMDFTDQEGLPGLETYRNEVQAKGKEFWWYVSCMSHGCEELSDTGIPDLVIDRPSVHARVIAWLTYFNRVDAFLYYSVNHGYQYYPTRDPLKDLWDFSGNGDGTLLYPGRAGEFGLRSHQPLPSLRLKLLRESSFDAEYLQRISLLPQALQLTFRSRLAELLPSPRRWKRSYGDYQSFRNNLGEALDAQLSSESSKQKTE